MPQADFAGWTELRNQSRLRLPMLATATRANEHTPICRLELRRMIKATELCDTDVLESAILSIAWAQVLYAQGQKERAVEIWMNARRMIREHFSLERLVRQE